VVDNSNDVISSLELSVISLRKNGRYLSIMADDIEDLGGAEGEGSGKAG
jgi:hypothetical protein